MKRYLSKTLTAARVRTGALATDSNAGLNGAFDLELNGVQLFAFCGDGSTWREEGLGGDPWEHVSVSVHPSLKRTPTWDEMCYVKDLFWDADETVVQFHPRASEYINSNPLVLHLWKPANTRVNLPPSICVGPPEHRKRFAAEAK